MQLLSRARSAGAEPGAAYQLQSVLLARQGLSRDAQDAVEVCYLYVHIYIYIYICICIYIYVCVCVCVCVYIHIICVYIYMYIYIYGAAYQLQSVLLARQGLSRDAQDAVDIYMYLGIYVCMHIHMCVCIYVYTYTAADGATCEAGTEPRRPGCSGGV